MFLKVSYHICKKCPHLAWREHPGGRLYYECQLSKRPWPPKIFYAKKTGNKTERLIWEREFEIPDECPFTLDYLMTNEKQIQNEIELEEAKKEARELYLKFGILTYIIPIEEET